MRVKGLIKVMLILLIEFAICYLFMDIAVATAIIAVTVVYSAIIGEYLGLCRMGAIRMEKLSEMERIKLENAFQQLKRDIRGIYGLNRDKTKLYLIPSEEINAYSFGFRNIAITRGALQCCDSLTINAVLAHEMGHLESLDAVINRIVFFNITMIILAISCASAMTTLIIFATFLILYIIGVVRGGFLSIFVTSKISQLSKGIFRGIQHVIIFVYRAVIGGISRRGEYRADRYSCDLGYSVQLSYFLQRFLTSENQNNNLLDVIYASHPKTQKRVEKIEAYRNEVRV